MNWNMLLVAWVVDDTGIPKIRVSVHPLFLL